MFSECESTRAAVFLLLGGRLALAIEHFMEQSVPHKGGSGQLCTVTSDVLRRCSASQSCSQSKAARAGATGSSAPCAPALAGQAW